MARLAATRHVATVNQAGSLVNAFHRGRLHRFIDAPRSPPGIGERWKALLRFGEPHPRPLLPESRQRGIIEIAHTHSFGDFIGGM